MISFFITNLLSAKAVCKLRSMKHNMAALAAQVTRQQRERIHSRNWKTLEISKCPNTLPPFDPTFNPSVHNKYVRNKMEEQADEFLLGCITELLKEKREEQTKKNTNQYSKIFEGLFIGLISSNSLTFNYFPNILGCSLLLVPVLWLLIDLLWPVEIWIVS